jgi:sugar-specific transcriptional regulator TrmB
MAADLTPFGFTNTENSAWGALLELGPSSAYAVAKRLTIARANAYQALDGLVSKGAASLVGTAPRRYRATQPRTVLAQLIDTQARKLDRLEQQIEPRSGDGAHPLISLGGTRAVVDAATRTILRTPGPVRCLAEPEMVESLSPAFRARRAAGRELRVWVIGPGEAARAAGADSVDLQKVAALFPAAPLLLAGDGALVAVRTSAGFSGYWGDDPLFRGLVVASLFGITSAPSNSS